MQLGLYPQRTLLGRRYPEPHASRRAQPTTATEPSQLDPKSTRLDSPSSSLLTMPCCWENAQVMFNQFFGLNPPPDHFAIEGQSLNSKLCAAPAGSFSSARSSQLLSEASPPPPRFEPLRDVPDLTGRVMLVIGMSLVANCSHSPLTAGPRW